MSFLAALSDFPKTTTI